MQFYYLFNLICFLLVCNVHLHHPVVFLFCFKELLYFPSKVQLLLDIRLTFLSKKDLGSMVILHLFNKNTCVVQGLSWSTISDKSPKHQTWGQHCLHKFPNDAFVQQCGATELSPHSAASSLLLLPLIILFRNILRESGLSRRVVWISLQLYLTVN